MRDLETVLCREHNRSQPRYPRFKLCPECRADVPREAVVVEAVVNYFSKPEFREFFIETEHKIQMGSDPRRADIVLLDKEGYFIAIAECKKINDVTYGREQLKSYLCATDTQFGIFANKKNPDEWEFYENLRRNQFPSMERFPFERKIARERTIESIREEKDRLDREARQASIQHTQKIREVESSDERLEDLNQKIRQANDQFADLKEKINSLKKEKTDLIEKITHDSQQAEVLEGLKLRSTRNSLVKVIHLLRNNRNQLQNEIEGKEQQRTDLSEEVNLLKGDRDKLKGDRDKLEREKNRIKSKRETLEREKEIWRDGEKERKNYNDYLKQINANLERSINHKTRMIRDIDRLSRLDELEEALAQKSIYEQIREELERLDKLELEIKLKQQLARQDQERHAAYKRNKVETNQKIQQLAQVSEEKESILKQLRIVVNQLKTANSEQKLQIEENRRQLVRDLRERKKSIRELKGEIKKLKEVKSKLEEEIRQEGQQLPFEENEVRPAYVQIQLKINKLKTEKSKIEAKIGHQIFLRLS